MDVSAANTAQLNARKQIIVILPPSSSSPVAPRESVRSARSERAQAFVAQKQLQAETEVAKVQKFFGGLGVRPEEGNDNRVKVEFIPNFPNAAYLPDEDHIHLGMDPRSGKSFGDAKDVVAHEYAHRVIAKMTDLKVYGEDSAIHESLADTFAAAYDADDWQIGEDIGQSMRTMDRPELHGDPGSVAEYNPNERDMHKVAGIPNRAAALIGDTLGRDTMAEIYIDATRKYVRSGIEIEGLALATMKSAQDLFGRSSREAKVTQQAWDAVGILDMLKARQ